MNQITRRSLLGASLAVPVAGALNRQVAAQEATPEGSPTASGYSADLLAVVDALMSGPESGEMPGVVVYIDGPQGQIFEAAGVADIENDVPMDKEAQFQIGSNTKMMTSSMVLQLQEEGLLNVDDLLIDYLPDVAASFPSGETITIRMLLNHTSGLYDVVEDMVSAIFVSWQQAGSTEALTQQWSSEDPVRYAETYRSSAAYFPPGTEDQWQYTNTGYFILGLLIESLTGKSYEENIQERIFDPLAMASTYYSDSVWDSPTQGYFQAPFVDFNTSSWNLSQGGSAGAVVSVPEDMAVFMRALLGGDLFEDPATLALMQETVLAPAQLARYGLGLIDFGTGFWGHGGETLGFQSKVLYNADTDVVAIAWTNTAFPTSENFTFLQFLLPTML